MVSVKVKASNAPITAPFRRAWETSVTINRETSHNCLVYLVAKIILG